MMASFTLSNASLLKWVQNGRNTVNSLVLKVFIHSFASMKSIIKSNVNRCIYLQILFSFYVLPVSVMLLTDPFRNACSVLTCLFYQHIWKSGQEVRQRLVSYIVHLGR